LSTKGEKQYVGLKNRLTKIGRKENRLHVIRAFQILSAKTSDNRGQNAVNVEPAVGGSEAEESGSGKVSSIGKGLPHSQCVRLANSRALEE